jgi:hypothetical protein
MKKLLLFIFCIGMLSCAKEELKKPDFILGYWNRVNNSQDKLTYEIWNPDFTGIGFTLQQSDTIFKEIMSIVELNDTLFLKVEGVNEKPTLFKFTEQTETSFTSENPENEFPKKIKYYMDGNQLKATISAGTDAVEFVFQKSF